MKTITVHFMLAMSAPASAAGLSTPSGVGARQCSEMPAFVERIGSPQVYGILEAYVDGYMAAKAVDLHEIQPRVAMRKVLDICELAPSITFDQACAIFAGQHQQ